MASATSSVVSVTGKRISTRTTYVTLFLVFALAVFIYGFGAHGARPSRRTILESRIDNDPLKVAPCSKRLIFVPTEEWRHLAGKVSDASNNHLGVSGCLHLLRTEGGAAAVTFQGAKRALVLDVLMNDNLGRSYFGGDPINTSAFGIRYRTINTMTMQGDLRFHETHRDQCIAAFAELGVKTNEQIKIKGKAYAVRDLLNDSIACFDLGQRELTWTATAYALYLSDMKGWTNRYNQYTSFDGLAEELLRRPAIETSCGGVHLIHATTILANADAVKGFLSLPVRERMRRRIRSAVDDAIASQESDGSWTTAWTKSAGAEVALRSDQSRTLESRVLATGHITEWLLYVRGIDVPETTLRKSAIWLKNSLTSADSKTVQSQHCPFSHTVCALRQLSFSEAN